ncbi:hypothetical protein SAMN04488109_3789 [Chryseolinea serpens]|uniref:Uncharacterized protein n=1 Tax=Chryseolinea serpens TaxID=947013 RepID=A0A1M5S7F5_9BACT|nr:hypothetical protein [Chryseolinea serpens]SHH34426.1 hypothetical protein SAMN04488109_3789 [Chryseolinea serpens]
MIDYSIILNILRSNLRDSSAQRYTKERCAWIDDANFIVVRPGTSEYPTKINSLNAVQYIERIKLLYSSISNEQ